MTKFCALVDIRDIITFTTFGDDRLRGLGVARGRISRFPIDLRRRTYNTLALPCECVMSLRELTAKTSAASETLHVFLAQRAVHELACAGM